MIEIRDDVPRLFIPNDGSHRNLDELRRAIGPVPAGRSALNALLGAEVRRVPERKQRVEMRIGDEHDITASATVPAIGAALGHELLPMKAHASVATLATPHEDLRFIDHEHG